jgi:hypothetical protein
MTGSDGPKALEPTADTVAVLRDGDIARNPSEIRAHPILENDFIFTPSHACKQAPTNNVSRRVSPDALKSAMAANPAHKGD